MRIIAISEKPMPTPRCIPKGVYLDGQEAIKALVFLRAYEHWQIAYGGS